MKGEGSGKNTLEYDRGNKEMAIDGFGELPEFTTYSPSVFWRLQFVENMAYHSCCLFNFKFI